MLDDVHVAEQPKPGHVFSLFLGVPKAEQKQISHFCKAHQVAKERLRRHPFFYIQKAQLGGGFNPYVSKGWNHQL